MRQSGLKNRKKNKHYENNSTSIFKFIAHKIMPAQKRVGP
ncbi:hypothetical protein NO042_50048 [Flavobacterium psychrophilum]|nr:hypothetical protein DK095_110074 [Flavobacterium psychrophilum]SNB11303.1 hypothetical protein JIP1600_1960006 [Flavobacterium psychrophilum]SNB35142.1 hypothetical protein NO042_50048 [Flavobacterium psychrophilum]SNB39309.1 hypothetical protein NO098_510208 [Flavobacterium psychrophilum]